MDMEVDKSAFLETSNNITMLQETVSTFRETSSDITMLEETMPEINSPSISSSSSPSSSGDEMDDFIDESSSSEDDPYENPYICEECDKEFITYESLEVHKCVKQYGCPICAKPFNTIGKLVVHTKIHFAARSAKFCSQKSHPKRFRADDDMKSDVFIHTTEDKPYSCSVCGKCFKHNSKLKCHMKTHNELYKCMECSKTFSTKHNLKRHSKDVHGVDDYKFELIILAGGKPNGHEEDQKCSEKPGDMNSHNTDVKPYACDDCGKCFASKVGLKRHTKIHTKEHSKGINGGDEMNSEMITLTEEKSNDQQEGQRSPQIHSDLNYHNTDAGPYKCDDCGKCFTTNDNLKMHTIIHTEEHSNDTYAADLKSKTITPVEGNSNDHEQHQKCPEKTSDLNHRNAIVKPYMCNECGKCFASKQYLKKHSKIHAKEDCKSLHGSDDIKFEMITSTGGKPNEHEGQNYTEIHSDLNSHNMEVSPYKCDRCGRYFTTSDILKMHAIIHTDEHSKDADVVNDLLSETISIIEGKSNGLNSHNTDVMPKNRCDDCGKYFASKQSLKRHVRTHAKEQNKSGGDYLKSEMVTSTGGKVNGHAEDQNYFEIPGDLNSHNTEERPFVCDHCSKRFATYHGLRRHAVVHTDGYSKDAHVVKNLISEMISIIEGKTNGLTDVMPKFKCDECGKNFTSKKGLKQHIKIHTREHIKSLHRADDTKSEMMTLTEGKASGHEEYQNCSKKPSDLNSQNTNLKPYKCDNCHKCFSTKQYLKRHSKIHTKELNDSLHVNINTKSVDTVPRTEGKPNEQECQDSTEINSDLNSHNIGVSLHKCDYCGKNFTTIDTLKMHTLIHSEHIRVTHVVDDLLSEMITIIEENVNEHEGQNFTEIHDVNSHDIDARPYKCDYCEKCFTTSDALKMHAVTHAEEGIKYTNGVDEDFMSEMMLPTEENANEQEEGYNSPEISSDLHSTDTEARPYKCPECCKSFHSSSGLNRHAVIHRGETPYVCKVCGKCFPQFARLTRHMRSHDKTYKCDECGKCFGESYTLKRHTKVHIGQKP